jgi:flagellar assembly factor FliW
MTGTETAVDLPSIDFVSPVPGFPGKRRFALVSLDEGGLLYAMRSLDDPELRFLVVVPQPFFPDYEPEIDDTTAEMLAITDAAHAVVLLVVNPGAGPADATANLLAPIVLNTETRRAAQVVLSGANLPVRAPLTAAA